MLKNLLLAFALFSLGFKISAQNTWLQRANFPAGVRQGVSTFEINNKIYMVGGWNYSTFYKELWEFDPAANTWTQKATFPGPGRQVGLAFAINGIGYYGTGDSGSFPTIYYNDLWSYDPSTDTWTQKGNFPGAGRSGAVTFVINNTAYAGTGTSTATTYLRDMWQYDPSLDTWTAKANFGGTARRYATAFAIGTKGYVGTGQGATGHGNTFYEYNSLTDTWTQKAGVPNGISSAVGFAINGKGYIGIGYNGTTYQQGFYEYNPIADTWAVKTNFGGGVRSDGSGISCNGKGYICAGYGAGALHNDMWEYTISTPTAPVASFTVPASICPGSCINIANQAQNSPDYYTWYLNGSATPSTSVASPTNICYNMPGTYTITQIVSNPQGSDTFSRTVTVVPVPSLTLSASSTTICAGTTTTLSANGASTYTWSPGSFTTASVVVSPISSTIYTLTGKSSANCISTVTLGIVVNPKPSIAIAGINSLCMGASQVYTVSGAASYTWSANAGSVNTATIIVSPTVAATYSVTGISNNNCINTASVNINILPVPTVSASGTPSVCAGSNATFTASGATSYTWSTGATTTSMSILPTVANAVYTVTGKGTNNCTNTATVGVSISPTPTLTVSNSNPVICSGGSSTLTASGANTYTWSTGIVALGISVAPAAMTIYTVTGTDMNSCNGTATTTVNVSIPQVTINGPSGVCAGNTATYTATGASTYSWSTGDLTAGIYLTPTASMSYSVTGTDAYGCGDLTSVYVQVWSKPVMTAASNSGSICAGSSVSLTASGATTYTWSNGSVGNPISVSPSATTVFSVTGADANQCTNTTNVSVTVVAGPSLLVAGTGSICAGSTASLTASGATSYTWSNGTSGNSIQVTPASSMVYTVTGTGSNACTATQTVTLTVDATCADVWPGDANSDGTANNLDVLELGLHYTQSGPPRASASINWQSHFADNWAGTITNGRNLNHSDCNGNGVIDSNDTLAIYINYGNTHALSTTSITTTNEGLTIVPDQPMVNKGQWSTASIYLGDASIPANNINGLAFSIGFDPALIETGGIYLEYDASFLNTGGLNLNFRKTAFSNGVLYTASTHTNNSNVSGYGKIATLHYQISSSLTQDAMLTLNLTDAYRSTATGSVNALTSGSGTIIAIGATVGMEELDGNIHTVIYPNPTGGTFFLQASTELEKIEIRNLTGQIVLSEVVVGNRVQVNVSGLSDGIYFISAYSGQKLIKREKVVIQR